MTEAKGQFSAAQMQRMREVADKRAESHSRGNEIVTSWLLAAALGVSAFGLNAALSGGDKNWIMFASAVTFGLSGTFVFATGLCLMMSSALGEGSESWIQLLDEHAPDQDISEYEEQLARGARWERRALCAGVGGLLMLAAGMALLIADYAMDISEKSRRMKVTIEFSA